MIKKVKGGLCLDIIVDTKLHEIIEICDQIISEKNGKGRGINIQEPTTVEEICKNIKKISHQIISEEKDLKNGLNLILSECKKITILITERKIGDRSYVDDEFLKIIEGVEGLLQGIK